MKNQALIDLMGKIDDEWIEEAAHPELLAAKIKRQNRIWSVKRICVLAACAVFAIGLGLSVPLTHAMQKSEETMTDNAVSVTYDMESIANAQTLQSVTISGKEEIQTPAQESVLSSVADAQASAELEIAAAAKAAADAAALASKAAASASKAAASASAAAAASAMKTTTAASVTTLPESHSKTGDITIGLYSSSGVTFEYCENVLLGVEIPQDCVLTDLVLPDVIAQKDITALDEDFWSFTVNAPSLKTITIPACLTSFGDVVLDRSVVIVCPANSPAAAFFLEKGYTIRYS